MFISLYNIIITIIIIIIIFIVIIIIIIIITIIIGINFKEQYLILPPKVPNFSPSPQITVKVVLNYQQFKPISHLSTNASQITSILLLCVYIVNVIYEVLYYSMYILLM